MKFIDVRIVSRCSGEELKEFLQLCAKIQYLGCIGSARDIKVHVDGDGSGSLLFYILEDGKETLLPTYKFDYRDKKEEFVNNLKQEIGG